MTVMAMIKVGNMRIQRDWLKRFRLPQPQEREDEGYDGRIDWHPDDYTQILMAQFRQAVINGDVESVRAMLEELQDVTLMQSEKLTSLLIDRPDAESTKEALLTAVCIGSRPLVEFILPLFAEFPGEEQNGECEKCERITKGLTCSVVKLDTYRAVSSETFLWLACSDPVLAAFNLALDLEVCGQVDQQYKVAYEQLHHNVLIFAVKIVQQCWSSEETDVLLSRKEGANFSDCQLRFPRVSLALRSHMKYFLASLNVQSSMEDHWHGLWNDYGSNLLQDIGRQLRHTLCYPVVAIIHALSAGRIIKSLNYPLARYISRLASYIVFLVALICIRFFGRVDGHSSDRSVVENGLQCLLEFYVYIYVYGMAVLHYFDFANKGLDNYYELWWRWFDLILLWLFSGSFFCWIMTIVTVHQDGIPKLHRRHWVYYDFSLVYDIYFGSACVMAFWRIFYFVQLRRYIGSTVISIGKCVRDVVSFLAIMAVIMLCFSLGVTTIYQAYTNNKELDVDGTVVTMKDSFSNIVIAFRNLYWSFYGYLAPWDYRLVVGNAGPDHEPTRHSFTVLAGEVTVAVFHITIVITLLNLMVSILVRTADEVLRNEDLEWKYTRCHIYMEFFEWFSAVPPPFNLIFNTAHCFYRIYSDDYQFIMPDLWVPKSCLSPSSNLVQADDAKYQKLLKVLFERYRCAEEYGYKTVFNSDAKRNIDKGSQDYAQQKKAMMLFMNPDNYQ